MAHVQLGMKDMASGYGGNWGYLEYQPLTGAERGGSPARVLSRGLTSLRCKKNLRNLKHRLGLGQIPWNGPNNEVWPFGTWNGLDPV